MKIRNVLGLAAAVPAVVVALATPGDATAASVVTFTGRIDVRPTALPQQQTLNVCFVAVTETGCANGATPTGVAAGQVTDTAAGADVVDGLQATARYTEVCAPGTTIAPVGNAMLSGNVHKAVAGQWSPTLSATWVRAGLVAVISGDAVGTALFTPVGVASCGQPVPVAVSGAVALTY
ncbi:MAG TPA: hypothetical protein VNA20_03195 [Frankiaceae bacterium]|nr:hypothetical protein [Frankiaceae bacterium]